MNFCINPCQCDCQKERTRTQLIIFARQNAGKELPVGKIKCQGIDREKNINIQKFQTVAMQPKQLEIRKFHFSMNKQNFHRPEKYGKAVQNICQNSQSNNKPIMMGNSFNPLEKVQKSHKYNQNLKELEVLQQKIQQTKRKTMKKTKTRNFTQQKQNVLRNLINTTKRNKKTQNQMQKQNIPPSGFLNNHNKIRFSIKSYPQSKILQQMQQLQKELQNLQNQQKELQQLKQKQYQNFVEQQKQYKMKKQQVEQKCKLRHKQLKQLKNLLKQCRKREPFYHISN